MRKEKAWVWFKGGVTGGHWMGGFLASDSEEGGFILEKSDFVTCRVPEWRVTFEEPINKNQEPQIPKNATWKYI